MRERSLKYFTLRHLVIAVLGIIAVWAAAFYWLIIEEVHDNIDDGLRDNKVRIIREARTNPEILKTEQYGISRFKIQPLPDGSYSQKEHIYNSEILIPYDDEEEQVRILRTIFSIDKKAYRLETYTSTVEEDELLEDLLTALLVLYFALVGSILLINHFVLKRAWAPFYQILEGLKGYRIEHREGFKKLKFQIKEFNQLMKGLFAMAQRNEKVYDQQKQFIGNASHELQTPLAIVGNKLELLMEEKDITKKLAIKIEEIHKVLNRSIRLNRSLLTLSKIENGQYNTSKNVRFNEIVQQSINDHEDLAHFREIDISIEETGTFEFEMNPELGNILINNLLKNAIFHGPKGGSLKILIADHGISIQNSGKAPLDAGQIFERFYKNGQNVHSTGLGLAIVKSIIGLYPGLSISYRFSDGHVFDVRK